MNPFSQALLGWYDQSGRTLPWRGQRDPYRVWVSEVMLQQTRVETVIPYYLRWIENLPAVTSVAEASLDEVLKLWEGLGYYSRCRNLHRACRAVVDEYGGQIPSSWNEFRGLPGVGDYTAAAVLSVVHGRASPAVDGNVARVMSRILASRRPVEKNRRVFRKRLGEWIDPDRPGDFNQAMMDLGSLVCRKNQPRCFDCPVTTFCGGYRQGNPERFPVVGKSKARPHQTAVVGIIWDGDRFLIQKRPTEGLLGGLWEFPGGKVRAGEPLKKALVREVLQETGLHVSVKDFVASLDHAYSHFSVTLHAFHCYPRGRGSGRNTNPEQAWIAPEDIRRFAFPRANHKLFELLEGKGWKR
ncbi:MAG: A/G-specific adenine glycosylase [Fidelibacterota bacterium]